MGVEVTEDDPTLGPDRPLGEREAQLHGAAGGDVLIAHEAHPARAQVADSRRALARPISRRVGRFEIDVGAGEAPLRHVR